MKKRVFAVAHIYKCGIQARHEFLHLGKVEVADGIGGISRLLLQRYQPSVFEQGGRYVGGLYVNYKFTFHCEEVDLVPHTRHTHAQRVPAVKKNTENKLSRSARNRDQGMKRLFSVLCV